MRQRRLKKLLICGSFSLLTFSKRNNEDAETADAVDPRPGESAYGADQFLRRGGWGGLISVRRGRHFINVREGQSLRIAEATHVRFLTAADRVWI